MEPVLIAIAAAAAGKATEAVVKGSAAAVKKAGELARRRFAGTPELEQAEQGTIGIEDFAEAIHQAAANDEEFHRQLTDTVGQPVTVAKFHNEFHGGQVKNLIQADKIQNLRLE